MYHADVARAFERRRSRKPRVCGEKPRGQQREGEESAARQEGGQDEERV